jgi:hypothetical protein
MYELLALPIVVQLTRDEARSARPDAPIVATRPRPHRGSGAYRNGAALAR